MTTETKPLNILHRYSDNIAMISLGHGYTCPSKATKKHMLELLQEFEDDEVLNIAQIETDSRPLVVWPVGLEEPHKLCYLEGDV